MGDFGRIKLSYTIQLSSFTINLYLHYKYSRFTPFTSYNGMFAGLPHQLYNCHNTRYFKRQILTTNFVERHDRLPNDTTAVERHHMLSAIKASAIRPKKKSKALLDVLVTKTRKFKHPKLELDGYTI